MSAARKLQAVPQPSATMADAEAELAAARKALVVAGAAVDAARAALDAAPRDAAQRAVLREGILLAEEDHENAKKTIQTLEERLGAAQRREDERALVAAVERFGTVAQMSQAAADAKEFITAIGGAAAKFFEQQRARNIAAHNEADSINAIWASLGHEHRCPGLPLEPGTGSPDVPPRLSLAALDQYEHHARNLLNQPNRQATPVEQATRQFLLGAISAARTANDLKLAMDQNVVLRMQAERKVATK